jgi:hypothetical protein
MHGSVARHDLKISHAENSVVETLIGMLNTRYEPRTPMTVIRGKIHDISARQ